MTAPSERLQNWSARALALILAVAVSVMFVQRPWIDPTLFQAGLFLLGGVWAIALVVRPFELRLSLPLIPLACAVAWGVLQLAARWTAGRADTGVAVLAWTGNLLAFFLAMQVCASSSVRRKFLATVLSFAFVLSVVSVVQYFSQDGKIFWLFPTNDSLVLGPFVNRDQYAAFIEMVLPLALFEALGGGSHGLGFAAVSAAMYASVIAGASRAGAILATAEIVLVPLIGRRRELGPNLLLTARRTRGWLGLFTRRDEHPRARFSSRSVARGAMPRGCQPARPGGYPWQPAPAVQRRLAPRAPDQRSVAPKPPGARRWTHR